MQKIDTRKARSAQDLAAHIIAFACALWLCGCVETGRVPASGPSVSVPTGSPPASNNATPGSAAAQGPSPADHAAAATGGSAAAVPQPTPQISSAPNAASTPSSAPAPPPASPEHPKSPAGTPAAAAVQPAVKAKLPAGGATPGSKSEVAGTATPVAAPALAAAAPAATVPAQPAQPTSPPPLDLTALKQRLRETSAIGVFTKLALKNQVDDLLDRFRAFYRGQVKMTLPELRQSYDLLVLKVLALLQDSDPPLAKEIATSREAIWGLLADPQKFATL